MQDRIQFREERTAIVLYPEFYIPQPFKWSNINMFQQFAWIHKHSIFNQRWKETSRTALKAWSGFANHFEGGSPFLREVSTGPADWDAGPSPPKSLGNNLTLGKTMYSQGSTSTFKAGRIHSAEEIKAVDPSLQQGKGKCQKVGEAGGSEKMYSQK